MKIAHSTMVLLAVVLALAGCSREAPSTQAVPLPAPEPAADLVAELARDPARLDEVLRQCREAPGRVDAALCIAAAKVERQRFMGDGEAKYTPEDVELFGESPPAAQDE